MITRQQDRPASPQPKQTPYERFLALPGASRAKPYPRGYRLLCPAHHDTEESLIFWEDEIDGHVGICCFANCQRADICAALGIRESDLYNGARPPKPGPERKLDLLHPTFTLDQFVDILGRLPLEFSPGEAWNYSVSTDVVGLVVERVSGVAFADFLERRLRSFLE